MSNPSYKASRVVIAFAAFVMMGSEIAVAGMRFPAEVVVFNRGDGSGIAEGSLGSARNSTDTNQYIGCSVATRKNLGTSVTCIARDSAGNEVLCSSNDADMIATARSLDTDSNLHFDVDTNGACITLIVEKYSYYEPKIR